MALAGPAIDLPGIRFEPQPPPPPDVLPRMDIAGFIGMAARGPLDTPVPVEDLAGFTAVFGGDLVLGVDPDDRTEAVAQLRPSVAAYFRNGGRRCWVVRIAGPNAKALTFPIPGVLESMLPPGSGGARTAAPARVRASSVGAWAGSLAVGASLDAVETAVIGVSRDAEGNAGSAGQGRITGLRLAPAADVRRGDVLRLRTADGSLAFVTVDDIRVADDGSASVALGASDGFRPGAPAADAAGWATCRMPDGSEIRARATASPSGAGVDAVLRVALPDDARPPDGSWVRFDAAAGTWWLVAGLVQAAVDEAGTHVRITGPAFRHQGGTAQLLDGWGAGQPVVDRLRLSLASGGATLSMVQGDLGLAPGDPSFVSALPGDEQRFGPDPSRPWEAPGDRSSSAAAATAILAGSGTTGFLVPLAVGTAPLWLAGPEDPGGDPDDVDGMRPERHLDERLATVDAARLVAEAEFIRFQSPDPRSLRGVHAFLDLDEVTLLAAPDLAAQRWLAIEPGRATTPARAGRHHPPRPTFDACDPGAPATPSPRLEWLGRGRPGFRVAWAAVPHAASYEVEVSREPASWEPPTIVEQRRVRYTESSPQDGIRRYRVRARNRHGRSAWSDTVRVVIGVDRLRRPDPELDPSPIVDVQAAMMRMCAARGDLFAILSLPRAMVASDVLAHADRLREALAPSGTPGRRSASPDADPLAQLSYAGIYHPWLVAVADPAAAGIARDREALPLGARLDETPRGGARPTAIGQARAQPPDGAVLGVYATRARERGAWVAAANTELRDVVAIDRPVSDQDLPLLHGAGVNVVRRTAAGFRVLACHSLSDDRMLRKANVRRLLATLRRIALLHGPDYVFEPNGDALRRRIQRGFDALLAILYSRGAFAGARADDAYRIEIGAPPDSPAGSDAGRLVVDLMVAPAVPLEFLTVRMVRSGDRFAVEAP